MKRTFSVFVLALMLAFLFLLWIRFIEPNLLVLERVDLEIEDFGIKNLKILHLSDFHTFDFGKNERDVLKIIEENNPDFIFITGDLVDWKTKDLAACRRFWEGIVEGKEGRVFAVYGNHEHRSPLFKSVAELMREAGIDVLINEAKEIVVDNSSFYLIGVDDPRSDFDNLPLAMDNVPDKAHKILLAHSPEIFREAKYKQISLVLVGHTHGCQVNLPFLCDRIIPLEYDKHYRQGLFYEEETYLYVNRGVGETFIPIRFNSLPEAALITINP